MTLQLLVLILLILLIAFFSASELAFVIAKKVKFEIKARRNNITAANAMYFFKNSQIYYLTILIGISAAQVVFSSMCAILLTSWFHLEGWTVLLITAAVLLISGEILPKYFARSAADTTLIITAIPIRIATFLLYPLVKLTSGLSDYLSRNENLREENINLLYNHKEIQDLIRESSEAGIVNEEETDILNRIIDLGDQRVYEVMRPRTEIAGVEITSSIDEVLQKFIESGYSKLPVYEDNLDNIKGIVFAYDLFKKPANLQNIMRNVIFVPDTKRTTEMLKEFSEKRTSFAVAVDEFGGTAGILTMEDIIEELLGEINDEYDVDSEICKKAGDSTWVISGKTEIDFVNEQFELNIPEGDYSTIGGFITSFLGKIPLKGETVKIGNFSILILRSSHVKIELVKLTTLPSAE